MAIFRNQLYFLALLASINGASAGIFSSFRFTNLLYSFHFCTHESHFCPMPPCDKMNGPEICAHYYCRQNGNNPGPANRECMFIGNCEGDQDCIATASYLGVETTSSSTSDSASESTSDSSTAADGTSDYTTGYATEYYNTTDADTTYSTSVGTGSRSNSGNVVASSHWAAYAVLGSVLTAFLLVVIWRKRSKIDNDQLGEELEPHGEDLSGAVARHHSKSQGDYVMA